VADPKQALAGTVLLKHEAESFWDFVVRLFFDTLKNVLLLAALSIIFFAAEWLKNRGMNAEHVERIELLHFWLGYGALAWIGIVFLVKLVMRAFA
jgi:hypothetical protein